MQQRKKSHDQGDQWQTQKKKQNKHEEQANPKTEQVTNNLCGLDTSNKKLTKEDQTSQDPGISSNMEPVIDLRVPLLHNPTVISVETVEVIDGVFEGMGGGMKYTQTNMHEGETKGRDLPNVLQEGESTDQLQVPIIHHGRNTPTQPSNNKSQAKLSNKRRNAIKKSQQKEMKIENKQHGQKEKFEDYDEYGVPNSKDEYDEDTQSLDDNDDEEDEITTTFGATFQTDYEEEIQEIKRQQRLSPRERKETRHNTTRARSRPITRARRRGL
ncbi:hypothetical protein KY284_000730 [Solanum tuberosum]|nr:hypothetical protein KY284_000730 [Solanum tuberosum]